MNQATSHLANRKELRGAVRNGRLLSAEGGRDKEKEDRLIFVWEMEGIYQADYLYR